SHEEEFGTLVDLYNNFAEAMASLTIHPRLRTDFYKGDLRVEVFNRYFNELRMPVGYNGDVITVGDIDRIRHRYLSLKMIMVGRALMADPALFRKAAGGNAATLPEIVSFYEALFDSYAQAFQSRKNALMRMKEYWFFQHNLFVGAERAVKLIYKAKTLEDYQAAIENIFENFELRNEATYGWKKPL
ncbi:MAG: tRNA-dihydrouridine synthase, partial [Candidatus Aphodousia sp.]|nr:tRNA-dihydrouridine synthase [Candidatus Aphodousia sp.]